MLAEMARQTGTFMLLAFPALFSIINPLGGAFIFLAATRGMEQAPAPGWRARWPPTASSR